MHHLVAQYQAYAQTQTCTQTPQSLYAPINYILSIGGKQLRPALVLAAYELWHEDTTAALTAAHAIEVFHNFTLMHDDIMDAADVRRGQPTAHIKYNVNTAILSGDAMLILAYQYLAKACASKPQHLSLGLDLFSQTAIEVCEGQQYDVDFETRTDVTIPEYIRMIELKTSVLLACALRLGAIIADASAADAAHLYEFGRNLGIAFQLQDDILDTFGDAATFGKRIGGDILNNKKTYLVLRTQQLADDETKNELAALLHTTNVADEQGKIDAVIAIFNRLNVRQEAEQLMRDFFTRAMISLDELNVSADKKIKLQQFAKALMVREV
jgi:geranylgeranyl diphosphate synthase, type II